MPFITPKITKQGICSPSWGTCRSAEYLEFLWQYTGCWSLISVTGTTLLFVDVQWWFRPSSLMLLLQTCHGISVVTSCKPLFCYQQSPGLYSKHGSHKCTDLVCTLHPCLPCALTNFRVTNFCWCSWVTELLPTNTKNKIKTFIDENFLPYGIFTFYTYFGITLVK